ncbi:MAG: hypothetical protein WC804_19680 [Sphingomonas sp.]|jgi:hypothetical protein|uniref:CcdC protein domain-containing protein n=1 Tax=Sphingomonas sp. TaxID=28214 RepID=UPI00356453CA
MQVHQAQPEQWIRYAVSAAIILVVLTIRLRRMSRSRKLRLESLWIVPALYLAIVSAVFFEFPPQPMTWLFCALALVVGGAIGWQRGKLMHIEIDPATHSLNQKASPAAFVFIVVLILVRFGARAAMEQGGGYGFHVNAMVVTDILFALALGLFSATRAEMYLRGKRMLEIARA